MKQINKEIKTLLESYMSNRDMSPEDRSRAETFIRCELLSDMDDESKSLLLDIVKEYGDKGSSELYRAILNEDYIRDPVGPEEFITSKDYIGRYGEGLWDTNKEMLIDVLDPANSVTELILSGSIGWGKSTCSEICLLYRLYRMSCLRDPAAFYRLLSGSSIVYGVFSVFVYKTDKMYLELKEMVDGSPYFLECFPRDKSKKISLDFPNNISFICGSEEVHALSENLYSVVIDEANFMKGSGNIPSGDKLAIDKSQAQKTYTATITRIRSRFHRLGEIPGIVVCLSSKRAETAWLEIHKDEIRHRPDVRIVEKSIWEAKPKGTYSGETFFVMVGNDNRDSRILEDDEIAPPDASVIEVPVEHRDEFESNVDKSIRDLAGRATIAVNPLIRKRANVSSMIDKRRRYPFTKETISISDESPVELADFLNISELSNIQDGSYVPILNPAYPRAVHIDLGLTDCSSGFCMGHVVRKSGGSGLYLPFLYIDIILEILPPARDVPPKKGEIDIEKLRNFVYNLSDIGYNIRYISLDGYQSRDCMQRLRQKYGESVKVEELSVDRDSVAYMYAKSLIDNKCCNCYPYSPLTDQLISVQYDSVKNKVIKEEGAYKDVSDSFAGVAYWAMTEEGMLNTFAGDQKWV